jgi:hypothetical protein
MIVALIKPAVLHYDHNNQIDLIFAVVFYTKRGLRKEIPDNRQKFDFADDKININ